MIVKMKKAKLVVLQNDKDALLKSLQRHGVMMIIKLSDSLSNPDTLTEDTLLQKTNRTMILLNRYGPKKLLPIGDVTTIEYDDFVKDNDEVPNLIKRLDEIEELSMHLKNDNITLDDEINNLLPWININQFALTFEPTKYTSIHLGYIEKNKAEQFENTLKDINNPYMFLDAAKQGLPVCFYCLKDEENELLETIKAYGYQETALPCEGKDLGNFLEKKKEQIKNNNITLKELENELTTLSDKKKAVEVYHDQLLTKKSLKKVDYMETIETAYLEGWVRVDKLEELNQAIEEATDIYDLELNDPEADEIPPTATKNGKFTSQFESITSMFSIPNYKEADPNPVMSIWYWILFGMMVGDVGYGIVLFVACLLFIKIGHPKGGTNKLAHVLMYSSIPTVLWGIVFNSFFGASIFGVDSIFGTNSIFGTGVIGTFMSKITFAPLNAALTMLIVSVIVGALHLMTGLVMKGVASLKEHDVLEFLAGQLSWILIMLGIGAYVGSMFVKFIPYLDYIAFGMIGLGVLFILLFKGRHKKGIINKAISGVLGLYDITGYMSDLLSYSRIMALVMSSAAVAMVMNLLAGMVQGSVFGFIISIFIYIIGHTFNLVLGLLSAYVHDSRLQYIEFFGKFYEGGGYDFKPLSLQTQYLYEITDKK